METNRFYAKLRYFAELAVVKNCLHAYHTVYELRLVAYLIAMAKYKGADEDSIAYRLMASAYKALARTGVRIVGASSHPCHSYILSGAQTFCWLFIIDNA